MMNFYEIDFNNIKNLKDKKIIPVLAVVEKNIYMLLPNKRKFDNYIKKNAENEMLTDIYYRMSKMFYYSYNNIPAIGEKIESYINVPLFKDKVVYSNEIENLSMFNREYKISRLSKGEIDLNFNLSNFAVKFAPDKYVENHRMNYLNNFIIMKKLIIDCNINDFKVYVCEYDELNYDLINKELKKIANKYLRKKSVKRYVKKDINRLVSRINNEVLSDFEKIEIRINKEFNNKVFLGDFDFSDYEKEILFDYLKKELLKMTFMPDLEQYVPLKPKMYAVALVIFGAKFYGSGKNHKGSNAFWPYFMDEFGVDLVSPTSTTIKRRERIVEIFDNILIEKNKGKKISEEYNKRLEDGQRIFERILVHTFVSDGFSTELFNRLLLIWQQVFYSNYEEYCNLPEAKEQLDSWIENNKQKAFIDNGTVGDIKLSTVLSFIYNKQSARAKILRAIKLIDNSYYNMNIIPDSERRMDHLLHIWMKNPKGKFQKLYKETHYSGRQRGKSMLFTPTIKFDSTSNKFELYFPQQFLKDYDGIDAPFWEVIYNGKKITLDPGLFEQEAGVYTQSTRLELEDFEIFDKFKITLKSNNKVYKPSAIIDDDVRFFNSDGELLLSNDFLPVDSLFIFSKENIALRNTSNGIYKFTQLGNIYELYTNFAEDEIIVLSDKRVIKVGKKINEGIDDINLVNNCFACCENQSYNIYSSLPSILFRNHKTNKAVSIFINNSVYKVSLDEPYKFDNENDDIFGYIIDLNKYIKNDGIYDIRLKINKAEQVYCIAYIQDFTFKFNNAPYIFNDEGSLSFNSNVNIIRNDDEDWNLNFNSKTLNFTFDEASESCFKRIQNQHMILDYSMNGKIIPIHFKIPALFWKFKENELWSFKSIKDFSIKSMPKKIYLSTPFNLRKSFITCDVADGDNAFDKIFADNINKEYAVFDLSKLLSNINKYEKLSRKIYLNISDKTKYTLFELMCKSKLISVPKLYADVENEKLIGKVEILGDADFYSVEVYFDSPDNLIGETVLNKKGEFEIETEIQTGKYLLKFFENYEDESGFGEDESVQIGNVYSTKVMNIWNLTESIITLNGYKNKNNIYEKMILFDKNKYLIKNLKHLDINEFDFDSIVQDLDKPIKIYKGDLSFVTKDNFIKKYTNVIVLFFDKYDISKNAILMEENEEYLAMTFNKRKGMLLTDYAIEKEVSKFKENLKLTGQSRKAAISAFYRDYIVLYDDYVELDIDIK